MQILMSFLWRIYSWRQCIHVIDWKLFWRMFFVWDNMKVVQPTDNSFIGLATCNFAVLKDGWYFTIKNTHVHVKSINYILVYHSLVVYFFPKAVLLDFLFTASDTGSLRCNVYAYQLYFLYTMFWGCFFHLQFSSKWWSHDEVSWKQCV